MMEKTIQKGSKFLASLGLCFSLGISSMYATDCPSAITLSGTLPLTGSVVCGSTNDINSSNSSGFTGADNDYRNGNEALYTYTPTTAGSYIITMSASTTWTSAWVYDACPTSGGVCVGAVTTSGSGAITVTVTLNAGTTYYIMFDTWPSPASVCENGDATYTIDLAPPPPTNDEATGAITLTLGAGCSGASYTNVEAAHSSLEPLSPITTTAGKSVWYSFVAPASGAVRVSTDMPGGTLTDTRISLFETTNPADYSTFVPIAADEDNGYESDDYLSILYTTGLTPGNTYYIMVEGYGSGDEGTFCLTVDELDNSMLSTTNNCSSSYEIPYSEETHTTWITLVDQSGKLIALVRNPAGSISDEFDAMQNINTGALRMDASSQPYLDRNFSINNASAATNVEVKLFFLETELTTLGATLSDLQVLHVTGAACAADLVGTPSIIPQTGNGISNGVAWVEFTTPSFSNFYLNSSTPLEIKFGNIAAKNIGSQNEIKWNSLGEKVGDAYQLERSIDGRHFETIATIPAKGMASDYVYVDEKPAIGINYYRILMKNIEGTREYSKIVSAQVVDGSNQDIAVYPNPVTDELKIKITGTIEGTASILITDISGKVIASITNVSDKELTVPMHNLASGVYIVKYSDAKTVKYLKVTKK